MRRMASAAAELLPLVYDELRKLAAARMAEEKPGQTLQATALVHEAYLRLVSGTQPDGWNVRGHFFAAQRSVTRGRAKKTYTNESGTKLSGTLHSAITSASACKTGAAACSLLRAFRN